MKYPLKAVDAHGNRIKKGDNVLFKEAPLTLIKGLLRQDQKAIKAQENKAMKIIGFDPYGHAEMEFTSIDGGMHTIWIEPQELFKVETKSKGRMQKPVPKNKTKRLR